MSSGNELVRQVEVDGVKVNVYGCWDSDTPEGKFDFYDLDVNGECINLGEPLYRRPTIKTIRAFVEGWKAMAA